MGRWSAVAVLLPLCLAGSATGAGGPVIQVFAGTTIEPGSRGIPNRTGSVDLGTTPVTKSRPTTFTVRNAGTADLTLTEPIRLPRGFTLVRSFGARTLRPGQATHFIVALNSARAGRLSGPISFGTNGGPGNRFSFLVTGTALGPPSMRIIDDGDAGFRTVGRWNVVAGQGHQGAVHTIPAGGGSNRAVWTFTGLRPGLYQVSATWPAQGSLAPDAQFTVVNGTKPFAPVVVNQSVAPRHFRDAGTIWHNLGQPYRITGDTLEVWLSDQASGPVAADAVRIERVGFPGLIVGPGDPGFQTAGGWPGAGDQVVRATSDRSTATWTFTDLIPGTYRISATWPATMPGAANASFTILDGARALTTVAVNQRQAPDDLVDAGRSWKDLGGLGNLFTIKGTSLVVRLAAPAGSTGPQAPLVAGFLRIERIYNPADGGGGPLISLPDIVRLLEQATWGPNDALIRHVQNDLKGDPQAFLDEQYSAMISSYPTPPLVLDDANAQCHGDNTCFRDNYTLYPVQNRFFTNALYGPDQLRQRVAFALHQINIVSGYTDDQVPHPDRYMPYLQIFDRNAFGNYRDVLYDISLNPSMGHYLNIIYSSPPNPNENYARELMQLFAVGLNFLNPDGTLQTDDNGSPIPTYTQDTVNNLARVFTGWVYPPPRMVGVTNYIDPMVQRLPETGFHDQRAKTLLQYPNAVNPYLPPGQPAIDDLNQAVDNIFYHPSVGPFISMQLIQKLVTSNPSPDYVARVESWFEDDGNGVRGNLWAVVQAILLDPEARGDMTTDPNFGHYRDPALYTCNVLRAFNAVAFNGSGMSDGYLNPLVLTFGMDLFRAPTVFSYYPPNYGAPGYAPLLGPEFAILDSVSTLKRANFINQMTFGGGVPTSTNAPRGTALNLTALQAMTPDDMADYLNNLLMHGTMSDDMRTALIQAINAVAASNPLKRARTGVYLITTSAQYDVQQ
jgi:uncharacterized protein (DUF1800 family)